MNRERLIEIARASAKAKPQSYYAEPFEPHEWVIDAMLGAMKEAAAFIETELRASGRAYARKLVDEAAADSSVVGAIRLAHEQVTKERERERAAKDAAYHERNQCVAALVTMATMLGWRHGLGLHDESDASWDREWMHIVFIDLPTGQVSWHIHDRGLPMFQHLKPYPGTWDGHTTDEKYQRLAKLEAWRRETAG